MRTFCTIIFTLTFGFSVLGTSQYPDKIIYEGTVYDLFSNPMESFFEKHPDKRPKSGLFSTALWRGYVATFEIRNSQLILIDIEVEIWDTTGQYGHETKWKSVFEEVFPDQNELEIYWFTGLLVIPHGKLINYVHMGYSSTFENYILLEIDNGQLKREKQFNYKQYTKFKEKQFKAFKRTNEYKYIKEKLIEEGGSDKEIDSFLRSFIIHYTSTILTK